MDHQHQSSSCAFRFVTTSKTSFKGPLLNNGHPKPLFSLKFLWNSTCQLIRHFAVETVKLYIPSKSSPSLCHGNSLKSFSTPLSTSALHSIKSTESTVAEWSHNNKNRSFSLTIISCHFTVLCAFRAADTAISRQNQGVKPLTDHSDHSKTTVMNRRPRNQGYYENNTDLDVFLNRSDRSSSSCDSENYTSEGCSESSSMMETPAEAGITYYCCEGSNDLQIMKLIGKGSFGKVVLARNARSRLPTAVKIVPTPRSYAECQSVRVEIRLLTLADHGECPFLAKMYSGFCNKDQLFLCMEYCNGGDLMYHIQKSRRFTEDRSRFYAAEVLCAISFLHHNGIMYRDVKLDNVLLDCEGHCKLTDFGMAKDGLKPSHQLLNDDEQLTYTFCGTPDYVAPELILEKGYNYSVDWWGLGILLYQMLLGQTPYESYGDVEPMPVYTYKDEQIEFQLPYSVFRVKKLPRTWKTEDEDELFYEILFGTISYPKCLGENAQSILRGASVFDTRYFDKEFTDQSLAEMSFVIPSSFVPDGNNDQSLSTKASSPSSSSQQQQQQIDSFLPDFDFPKNTSSTFSKETRVE